MAGAAILDRVDVLSLTERLGVIRSLTTKCRVLGITSEDFSALNEALNAVGIPAFGANPTALLVGNAVKQVSTFTNPFAFRMLVLTERKVHIVDDDPGCFDVTCEFEHLLDGPHQNLMNPDSGVIYGKMTCAVTQKTTNFYRINGEGEIRPIVVGYTYPVTDKLYGATQGPNPTGKGQYKPQGGEVSVMFPQETYRIEGYINTLTPWDIKNAVLWHLNDGPWLGGSQLEWMCTEVQYEILSSESFTSLPRYKFYFEWQRNTDTWNPTAVYTDENSGKPPKGLTYDPESIPPQGLDIFSANPNNFDPGGILEGQAYGYLYVRYYPSTNFNTIFGAAFEGWVQVS